MDTENILTAQRIREAIEVLEAAAGPDDGLLRSLEFNVLTDAAAILHDELEAAPAADPAEAKLLDEIRKDKWNAVELVLPPSASRELLVAFRDAADACAGEARREWRNHDPEDAGSVGWAAEMQWAERRADERVAEINELLACNHP